MHQFAEVLRNGTLKLYNVGRNCSGKYTVNAYNDQGVMTLNESYDLVVIDPPVVELVACTLEVSVLHCAGENVPDAEYDWRVSVLNQGHRKIRPCDKRFKKVSRSQAAQWNVASLEGKGRGICVI
ncbi:hypothetical protein SKAU_G00365540 [Synaphobranchus kaupii]|uniref:Uncharacterized protein n=1 Tax=Synaphobranchus kaupii TaxID=118154 RepID=A0A9Q1IDB0_SYNKA|nr:hypothetical protein SKAU_G00365540 [Synaphobranchus kaupii]